MSDADDALTRYRDNSARARDKMHAAEEQADDQFADAMNAARNSYEQTVAYLVYRRDGMLAAAQDEFQHSASEARDEYVKAAGGMTAMPWVERALDQMGKNRGETGIPAAAAVPYPGPVVNPPPFPPGTPVLDAGPDSDPAGKYIP